MNNEGSFMIDGWKTKHSNYVYSDKNLLHGAADSDFEKVNLVIAKSEIERLHQAVDEG